jgi:hypothetical protein
MPAHHDSEPRLGMCGQGIGAGRLAGFRTAQLEHMPPRRRAAEVVVEGDDAVDFGPRTVQGSGDQRLGGLVDAAEFLLQGVQNGQQRAVQMQQFPDALARQIGIPRRLPSHFIPSTGIGASELRHMRQISYV